MTESTPAHRQDIASYPLTRRLAEFVVSLKKTAIPPEVQSIVLTGFTDCVGVTLAGADEDVCRILDRAMVPSIGGASTLFSTNLAHPAQAAWINATAAHALDYDDAALRGHPSAVLVPTIIAECQDQNLSGADAITAYVAGYEVWAELAHRDRHSHHRKGWHPTGIFGSIAAAAACASLHNLDADATTNAIAIAASCSSGIMANFGSMTKPFHAGRSAQAGVMAARLAKGGMSAAADALEHPQGFLSAVSFAGEVDKATPVHAVNKWHILRYGLNLKKYPMCYCTHRPIDAMIDLAEAHAITPEQVERVSVSISGRNATVLRNHAPKTALEAKFSIEFAMASSIVARKVGLEQVEDGFVQRPDIQALIPKVSVVICEEEDPDSGYAPYDFVVVRLKDGRTLESARVADARGAHAIPLTRQEKLEKFLDCAVSAGLESNAVQLFERLESLDREKDLHFLNGVARSRQ